MKKIMKSMIGRLAAVLALAVMGASLIAPNTNAISVEQTINSELSTFAAIDCAKQSFMVFGLRPWYSGLTTTVTDANNQQSCALKKPDKGDVPLQQYIWMIVLNILVDLFFLVGFAALGFMIYGGFLYMSSAGDPSRAASGKNTLLHATIGLVIAVLANVITNTLINVIFGAAS
jgi:hypothetical protein